MSIERDSFIFYRSFAKSIKRLSSDEDRLKLYDAIVDYALDGKVLDDDSIISALMELIVPQIDANNKRYENGKKGGRPKTNGFEEDKRSETSGFETENQTETIGFESKNQTKTSGFKTKNHRLSKSKPNKNVNEEMKMKNVSDDTTTTNASGSDGPVVVVADDSDDFYDLRKRLTANEVDLIYDVYPETGGDLIETVAKEVKKRRRKVDNPAVYILGYAEKVGWLGD